MGGRKTGYLTSAQVKRGLRKYLHLKLSRHELKNLIGKQLEDDRLSYPEFVGLVNAGAEAARRAGENDDDNMSDTTYSQSNISAASLSLGLRQKMREEQESSGDHSPITVKVIDQIDSSNIDSRETNLSASRRVEHAGGRQKAAEVSQAEAAESTAAAAQMTQNYEVAAQLGQLAQQLAVLQEQVVQKQLALMPEPPPRSLPPLKLGPAPPRSRTAMDDLKDLFSEVDSDGSGSIGAEELRAMVQAKVGSFVDKTAIDGLISQADKDGDGAVDWSEFVAMAEAHGWATPSSDEEQPELPFARLSCSTDRHWAFHIRSKSRRAILGRMPAELSADENEISQTREQRDPEDRVNPADLDGKDGTTTRCILPCNGLSKELVRKISRRHCEIKLEEENGHWRWTVCSLDGHQFLLNGIRITSHHGRCPLQSYDRIGIGPIVVVFHPEGGDTAAQLAAQAAASTAAALTHGIEIDPEDHAQQEQREFAEFVTHACAHWEAKLDGRLDAALHKFVPEPEPEPEPEVEPEVEEEHGEEENADGKEEAVPSSQGEAEQLSRQLGVALKNYMGYYGSNQNTWTAAENLTVGALCAQLATAYETMGMRDYAADYRDRTELYRHRAEMLHARLERTASTRSKHMSPKSDGHAAGEADGKARAGWADGDSFVG
jgi:hypothetical protein